MCSSFIFHIKIILFWCKICTKIEHMVEEIPNNNINISFIFNMKIVFYLLTIGIIEIINLLNIN